MKDFSLLCSSDDKDLICYDFTIIDASTGLAATAVFAAVVTMGWFSFLARGAMNICREVLKVRTYCTAVNTGPKQVV